MKKEKDILSEQAFAPNTNNILPFSEIEEGESEGEITIIADGLCEPNQGGTATWGFCSQ